ncbi:hypothetical protein PR048_002605 [Dryococelus australis]|uniref:Envelope protein n=1 Tax=Dryococelus australis TaxID=614101 RepID=A0ABQ9IKQ6_9NEOP|nr:hypothetical protein PR048_002605 [Dryococelus australis]
MVLIMYLVTTLIVLREDIFVTVRNQNQYLNRVAHYTNSLIGDVDNCVEQLNSFVAKTIGGKRYNFSMRQFISGDAQMRIMDHMQQSLLSHTRDDKLAVLKEEYLRSLQEECTDERRRAIQSNTKDQTTSQEWREHCAMFW